MISAENFGKQETKEEIKKQSNIEEDDYYMGKDSNIFTRFLSLQYFRVLPAYKTHYDKKKFIKVRPQYSNTMIPSEYLWNKFLSQGALFNLYKEIFEAEKKAFVVLIIISALIGALALFGAYYQRFLFAQLLDHNFEVSGWVFFAIITTSAILRFFMFNYVQNLANMIATNIRCHLENGFIRLIFHLPKNLENGLLINNFFVSIEIVSNTIKLLPYFIISLVIVSVIVGFIIDIVGAIGLVVLGFTLIFVVAQIFILSYMFHLHHEYVKASDKRTSLTIFGTSMLLRLTYNGLTKVFSSLIKKYRKDQTDIDRKYNAMDGAIQIMTESISFLSLFIFYLASEYNNDNPSYIHILDAAILFSVFKTPIKMVGYGLSMCLQGYASIDRLQQLYHKCEYSSPPKTQMHFNRIYPLQSCFETELVVPKNEEVLEQISLKTDNLLNKHQGELIMILGKIDADPNCDMYLEKLENSLKDTTYYKIDYHPLITDKNIRENITFGLDFNEEKYNEVLETVNLKEKLIRFPEGDLTRMDENYFKTIYVGLSLSIQLARALYNDVEVLIINRLIFKQYEEILIKIRQYRKIRKHMTIVVNLSGSHYDIADWLIVLGKKKKEEGTYEDLIKRSSILKQFEVQYLSHIELVSQSQATRKSFQKLEQAPLDQIKVNCCDFFGFYNLAHYGAGAILLILLLIPPLLDLYMEVVIAESVHGTSTHAFVAAEDVTHEQKHFITLRFGIAMLLFIIMNVIKIFFFSLYLRISGYQIVKKVINSFLLSKVENTLDMSNRKNALDLERNIEQIDTRITADMDVGITIIFQQLTAMIFGVVSSILFLAIGLPFFIITIIIIIVMVIFNRKILFLRRMHRSRHNSFVKKLIQHRKDFTSFGKDQMIFKEFVQHKKYDIQADLNEEWLMQALGIILEVVFILILIITMAVSLVEFDALHTENAAFLQLAISFLIGLSNGARINLKIFRSMDKQLIGIASINKVIEHHEEHKTLEVMEFPDNRFFTIQWKHFNIIFKDDILYDLNMKINAGERIVITGSRISGKRVAFYAALGIFEPQHISGDIYINRVAIYEQKVTRHSVADKIFILQNQTLTFFGDTVAEAIKARAPRRATQEIDYTLNELWNMLGIEPLFTSETKVSSLSAPCLDLFSLVRALMVRPQMLVLEGGLSHIDTLNRRKLTQWLIKNNEISILIDLTNRIEVIELYPRLIEFFQGRLIKDQKK